MSAFLHILTADCPMSQSVRKETPRKRPSAPPNSAMRESSSYRYSSTSSVTSSVTRTNLKPGKTKTSIFYSNLVLDSLYRNQHLLAPYWPPGSGSRCREPCTGSSCTAPSLSDLAGSFEPWDTSYNEIPDTVFATSFNLQYVICSLTLLDIPDIFYTVIFYYTSSFLQQSSNLKKDPS